MPGLDGFDESRPPVYHGRDAVLQPMDFSECPYASMRSISFSAIFDG